LKIVAGAQYNTTNDKQSIVPRLGVVYHVGKTFTTKVMYGEAFRNGSSYERFSREDESYGNRDLNPETIKTLEVNVMYNALNKKTYLSLTGYYSNTANTITISDAKDNLFIDPITQKSYAIYINSKNFRYYGLELEGSHNFTDRLQTHFSFTLRDVTQPIADAQVLYQATGIPNFMGKIGLLYRNKQNGLQGGAFYSYIGQTQPLNRYNINGNPQTFQDLNPATEAYHYLTCHVEADIKEIFNIENSPSILFSVLVQNALNAKVFHPDYKRSVINSVPGRSERGIYGRLAVKF
jgi:outer membrane cobalamin receptor